VGIPRRNQLDLEYQSPGFEKGKGLVQTANLCQSRSTQLVHRQRLQNRCSCVNRVVLWIRRLSSPSKSQAQLEGKPGGSGVKRECRVHDLPQTFWLRQSISMQWGYAYETAWDPSAFKGVGHFFCLLASSHGRVIIAWLGVPYALACERVWPGL
jgi:hypothetical protein